MAQASERKAPNHKDKLLTEHIDFPTGNRAHVVRVSDETDPLRVVAELKLPRIRAVALLNGGTAPLAPELQTQLGQILIDGLARVAAEEKITLITGGTEAGIFALLGKGRARWGRTAPCIGVTVGDLVTSSELSDQQAPLEPHHSHFVLVKGSKWGDETTMMYGLADELSQECPSIAIFAGGGEIVIREMQANLYRRRTMLLLAGSGRSTDALIAVQSGQPTHDQRLVDIAAGAPSITFDMHNGPEAFHQLLRRHLF